MTTLIYDIESDGLLNDATKIHCVVIKWWGSNRWGIFVSPSNYARAKHWVLSQPYFTDCVSVKWFSKLKITGHRLVAHNQIGFDVPMIKKFFDHNWAKDNELIDTLVMSRYLNPDLPSHSLAAWGEKLTKQKVSIEDWKDQPIETYLGRCVRDVEINELLYTRLRQEFKEPRIRSGFSLALKTYASMFEQERTGVMFDQPAAKKLREILNSEMERIASEVEPQLGSAPLPKTKQPTWPKKPFKKDGTLSKSGLSYGEKIGVTDAGSLIHIFKEDKPIVLTQPITLDHMADVKKYLYTKLGWIPTIWRMNDITRNGKKRETAVKKRQRAEKYVKDIWSSVYRKHIWKELSVPVDMQVSYEDLSDVNKSAAIRFVIRRGRELPMSPQFCYPVSKAMCLNLEKLKNNIAKDIVKWMALKNRRGIVTGWLEQPRLKVDGRLGAGSAGITNTHRQRHHTVVNVPRAHDKAIYGTEMRSLFVAPPGTVCVGCDAAGLENRIAGHFAWPYDDGAYARELLEGDTHTKNAVAYSKAAGSEITRQDGKTITYATLYGASPKKLAVLLSVQEDIGFKVVKAFWDANPGLKCYREVLEKEWENNNKRFIWGLDGRYVPTRSKHSLVNASFQSAGAIIMDRAWQIAEEILSVFTSWNRWGYFHDEYQLYSVPEIANQMGLAVVEGIKAAGQFYSLNVPLDGDYKIGSNWAETH